MDASDQDGAVITLRLFSLALGFLETALQRFLTLSLVLFVVARGVTATAPAITAITTAAMIATATPLSSITVTFMGATAPI